MTPSTINDELMPMELIIPHWSAHYNQILYSLMIYTEQNNLEFKVTFNESVPANGSILIADGRSAFLDYSDDFKFAGDPTLFDCYFKRSLSKHIETVPNIHPLNFQVNFAYKPLQLLLKMDRRLLFHKKSRTEVFRALDVKGLFTNDAHSSKNLKKFTANSGMRASGRILFMTRLWDPARTADDDEKQRRVRQNNFRIGACRIIKKNFKDSTVGLFPEPYAQTVAADILLNLKDTAKKNYLSALVNSDIAIADDGLKDSTGWKLGEYVLAGKAIISTPINTVAEEFNEKINYLATPNREDFESLPDLLESLLAGNTFLKMQAQNLKWSNSFLIPEAYVSKILQRMSAATL